MAKLDEIGYQVCFSSCRSSAKFLWLWQEVSEKAEKLLAKVQENSEAQNLQNLPILCCLFLKSAMVMAMSIYRTLCVLVIYPCISSILWPLNSVFWILISEIRFPIFDILFPKSNFLFLKFVIGSHQISESFCDSVGNEHFAMASH